MKNKTTTVLAMIVAACFWAGIASAQSTWKSANVATVPVSRVIVQTAAAPIYLLPDANRTPLRTASEGSALNALQDAGDWYQVEFSDPQFGRRVGYVEKRHVIALAATSQSDDLTIKDWQAARAPEVQRQPAPAPAPVSAPVSAPVRADVFALPKWESSFGWGFTSFEGVSMPVGWTTSVAGTVNPWFSIAGDFSGAYKSIDVLGIDLADVRIHTWMAGPRFVGRLAGGRVNPFGQLLAGVMHGRLDLLGSNYASATTFGIQPGGGVDVAFSEKIALRMQVDFPTALDGGATTHVRFSPGIVIRSF